MTMATLCWVGEAHRLTRRQAQAQKMGVSSLLSSLVFVVYFQHPSSPSLAISNLWTTPNLSWNLFFNAQVDPPSGRCPPWTPSYYLGEVTSSFWVLSITELTTCLNMPVDICPPIPNCRFLVTGLDKVGGVESREWGQQMWNRPNLNQSQVPELVDWWVTTLEKIVWRHKIEELAVSWTPKEDKE